MSVTTSADLLERADQLARELAASSQEVNQDQWEQFDNTVYRTLYELIAADRADPAYTEEGTNRLLQALRGYPAPLQFPPERTFSVEYAAQVMDLTTEQIRKDIWNGRLRAVKDGDRHVLPAQSVSRIQRGIPPADPTDPHPLSRVSVALGAFADLVGDHHRTRAGVQLSEQTRADTVRRVLALTAVAAQYTVKHTGIEAIERPVLLAKYASTYINALDPSPRRIHALDNLVASIPDGKASTVNQELDAAMHDWRAVAQREVRRLVPSTEALAAVANQGVRIYSVTHHLLQRPGYEERPSPADRQRCSAALREGGVALRDAQLALRGLTSLTVPAHDFVTSSRALFATLQQVRQLADARDPELDTEAAIASLARACTIESELLSEARPSPSSLLHCGLLFAPARRLPTNLERLEPRAKGRFIPVQLNDVPELGWRWELAARKAPEVEATVGHLVVGRDQVELPHGIEFGL